MDLKIFFKKKFKPSTYIMFLIIIVLLFLLFRSFAVYLFLIFCVSVIVYINYVFKLPFDLSPVLVISLIISRNYGFFHTIIFVVLSGIVPMILAGGSFDHTTLFYFSLIVAINLISTFFTQFLFLIVAFLLIIIHHFIAMVGSIFFGTNKQKEIFNFILKLVIDSTYLLMFYKISFLPL